MTDIPSYKVTNQHRKSWVLHQKQLLVTSEVGVPLCLTSHHTWDRCTSPTPCNTTSARGEQNRMPQENNGKAVTQWPTSKASLGWINGNLWLLLWISTGVSTKDRWSGCRPWKNTYIRQREQCWSLLMPADSEPDDESDHSWNWVMVGKAKQNKGEWNR